MSRQKSERNVSPVRRLGLPAAAVLLGLVGHYPSAALAEDDYQKFISEEVKDLAPAGAAAEEGAVEADESSEIVPAALQGESSGGSIGGAVLLDLAGFENRLLQEFPGSYLLYMKLDDKSRRSVFEEYRRTGQFADARQKLINLSSK